MRAIIAGAGIGGLTTALALHRRGIEVQLYESVRELAPLGVGINILPMSMAELDDLDAASKVIPLGLSNRELCFYNRHGQLVWREDRGSAAGHRAPQLSIHRGRLQLALAELVAERLGPDAVHLGVAVRGVTPDARGVRAELVDRHSGGRLTDRADILIGADGIHSRVRQLLYPDEGPPLWNGTMVWRATTVAPPILSGRTMVMVGHTPLKFIAYPITDPDGSGHQLINWICAVEWRHRGLSVRESWTREGSMEDFLPLYAGWRFDWLDIPQLIEGATEVFEFPLVDRDPLPRWTFGGVTLLGDAAHPMYPVGSNGASQAILDAATLAGALAEVKGGGADAIAAALGRYEASRLPATAAIVAANRQQGAERILDMAEERAPDGFTSIDDVFAPGELQEISDSYKRLIGLASPPAGR